MKAPYIRIILTATTALLLLSCKQEKQTVSTAYEPVVDNHHLMMWVLEPPAEVIWDSAGYIITAAGEQDLSPTTDEGWEHVARHAAALAEGGNLLMLPGRSLGPDWDDYSKGLIFSGKLALDAAERKDSQALFDAGARIYQVCLACHNQYWVVIDDTDG